MRLSAMASAVECWRQKGRDQRLHQSHSISITTFWYSNMAIKESTIRFDVPSYKLSIYLHLSVGDQLAMFHC